MIAITPTVMYVIKSLVVAKPVIVDVVGAVVACTLATVAYDAANELPYESSPAKVADIL